MPTPQTPPEPPTRPAELDAVAPLPARRAGSLLRLLARALGLQRPRAAEAIDPLAARAAFVGCLADVPALDTRALCHLLSHTRSLSELWHLRPEVYRLLALHHSQAEAERRLAVIGRQFDRRASPRRAVAPGAAAAPATRPPG